MSTFCGKRVEDTNNHCLLPPDHSGGCDDNFPDPMSLTLHERVILMEEKINEIHAMMVKTDAAVGMIVEQVKPTLDELSKSPILKMLGMKR